VYYGFREAELAFTKLFGGFEDDFYHAYHETYPLEPGFEQRAELYNLYPLLVHTNLFGASYLGAVERTLARWV
jgi:fructosamine-3-kinase